MGIRGILGMVAGQGLGTAVSQGLDNVFGISKKNDKRQIEQQKKLNEMQEASNLRLMQESYGLQKDMYGYTYDKNTPLQQVKNLKEAGLNPALLYGLGGMGGTTAGSGSASIGGASASGSAETEAQDLRGNAMGIESAMAMSQMKVNEAQAEKLKAEASNIGSNTETTDKTRDLLVENLRQSGVEKWLDNVRKQYENSPNTEGEDMTLNRNAKLNWTTAISKDGAYNMQVAGAILKTQAEIGNTEAMAMLTNEKAKGYYQELLNETMKAQAAKQQGNASEEQAINGRIQAVAQKLATEWGTGEYTNWKTWKDTAIQGIQIVTSAIK